MRIYTAVLLALASVTLEAQSPKDFLLRLETTAAGPRKIRVAAVTDLPDGALLLIGVSRDYDETLTDEHLPKRMQTAAGEIFQQNLAVSHGRVEATVDVDDTLWVAKRRALAARMLSAGMVFSPVRNIRPVVEVSALYTPMTDGQPPAVLKATGLRGALIKNGEGSGLRTLRTMKTMAIPFNGK